MTKLKDKLSASVRTVKAAQQKVAPAATPATKSVATKKPASPAAAPRVAATPPKTSAGALFPDRVWPD